MVPVGRVWIVAHRRELVEQIEETVSRYGMGREDGSVRVMSIQWLSRNRKIVNGQPDLIVIDEAHHALAETYRELWKSYPEARKLGMTATPCRLNRKGFTDLFDTLITCNLQIFLCLFLEKLNMPQNTPVTKVS